MNPVDMVDTTSILDNESSTYVTVDVFQTLKFGATLNLQT